MDQGGVSWLLLNVREKMVKHQRRRRCFHLQNKTQHTYSNTVITAFVLQLQ